MSSLEIILGSKARAEVFRILFSVPGTEIYLREIQRLSGMSIRPIQDEIARALKVGLIKARKDGNRTYYSSNPTHPLHPEIRSLVEKTVGYRALLKDALHDDGIKFAFIFGSVAAGTERPDSDLDLFIIGDTSPRQVIKLLSGLSNRIGREINTHTMTLKEFIGKIQSKNHFISNIIESDKVFLIGDSDEFKKLGRK